MKRVHMVVAYDGTKYCGWQIQKTGKTIEAELNRCLTDLFKEEIMVIGASRTDSGVHALCNEAVFDTSARMPADKVMYALNQRLPEDIKIMESKEVDADYHPRRQNTIKTYQYRIATGEVEIPTERLYNLFLRRKLDVESMHEAARYLKGEHDFKSFCNTHAVVETTVRTITDISVYAEGHKVIIQVSGTGFLYNMVRIIAGTLIEVGIGRIEPQKVKEMLAATDRGAAGPTAPPQGLFLYKYEHLD
jgi:tRNA pseudouridine38-40 synthase